MRGLIEFIARNLVDDAEAVDVRTIRDDRYASVVGLSVGVDDLGKVIGRQGRVAKAMRTHFVDNQSRLRAVLIGFQGGFGSGPG